MDVVEEKSDMERGHSSNSIYTNVDNEEWEEFEQVPANMDPDEQDQDKKCRFCWMLGASTENPLLGTCKCAGSVGFIHLNCLKEWLNVKR
jgi:hypothetical protein